MTSNLSDNELWEAVVADDSRAFETLYDRYWRKLYTTACYYLKEEAAAEEITHDVFVSLWEKRKSSRINNFQFYLQATARYQVYKYLKSAKINYTEYLEQLTRNDNLRVYNTAATKLQKEDMESELSELLKDLPRRCREIFWLSRVDQLSNQEIADKLHISKRTVENQITLALRCIRTPNAQLLLAVLISHLIVG